MTEPGWDIPGVPREPAASPEPASPESALPESALPESPAGAGAGQAAPPRRGRAAPPLLSVSLLDPAGSTGAFPRPAAAGTCPDGAAAGGISPDGAAAGGASPDSAASDSRGSGGGAPPGSAPWVSSAVAGISRDSTAACAGSSAGSVASDGSGADGMSADGAGAGGFAGGAAEALGVLAGVLEFLAHDDVSAWPEGLQADCLRALAVAEARQAAVHARVLAAFSVPGGGLHGDGHASPRMWLSWQARATRGAAAGQVSWMRRLAAHPRIAAALAGGAVSLSWAALLAGWTEVLPAGHRDDADRILLAGVAAGAGLADLAAAAAELAARHAAPDRDDDGFEDRRVRLGTTFGGTGRVDGDLTARCAAAVTAVLDSLSGRRGAEDTRTLGQRYHDGLEEACLRLLAAGTLPERAGQPVRLEVTLTLDQLTAGGSGSPAGPAPPATRSCSPSSPATSTTTSSTASPVPAPRTRTAPAPARAPVPGATAAAATRRRPVTSAMTSWPGRSRCCPARPGTPPSCAPGCPACPAPRSASPSTSPAPWTPSRSTCAAPSGPGTGTAGSPAATCPRPPATSTTSGTAKTAAATPSPT